MQQKIIIDTNVYIDIFNNGLHETLRNPFQYIIFLAHPVLHELWIGAKEKKEINHLESFQAEFIKLGRLILPAIKTLTLIGRTYQKLRASDKVNPIHTKHYNDISIAALARQIGATVITHNTKDFKVIQRSIDFDYKKP